MKHHHHHKEQQQNQEFQDFTEARGAKYNFYASHIAESWPAGLPFQPTMSQHQLLAFPTDDHMSTEHLRLILIPWNTKKDQCCPTLSCLASSQNTAAVPQTVSINWSVWIMYLLMMFAFILYFCWGRIAHTGRSGSDCGGESKRAETLFTAYLKLHSWHTSG